MWDYASRQRVAVELRWQKRVSPRRSVVRAVPELYPVYRVAAAAFGRPLKTRPSATPHGLAGTPIMPRHGRAAAATLTARCRLQRRAHIHQCDRHGGCHIRSCSGRRGASSIKLRLRAAHGPAGHHAQLQPIQFNQPTERDLLARQCAHPRLRRHDDLPPDARLILVPDALERRLDDRRRARRLHDRR